MREKKPANRDSTRIFVIVTALTILFAVVFSPIVCADQTEPSNPPPEPTLTIAKDVGTGEIVLTWTATTSPYSVSRHTGPYFFDGNSPQVLAAGLLGTTYVDASLGDGINRFYIIEDANAAPRVYSLSSNAALPGSSVTVSGVGFDSSSPSANEVLVTGEPATVTAVTDSTVTFTMPTGVVSGHVIASTSKGASAGLLIYAVVNDGLGGDASSVGVDETHTVFVTDTGTDPITSDRVFKIDTSTGFRTQVGSLNEAIGLATDGATPRRVYYGNGLLSAGNFAAVRRTDRNGTETTYGRCGDSTIPDACNVFAVGLDSVLTDFGPDGRVYVADGAGLSQKVRIVRPTGSVPPAVDFATGFTFGVAPRGLVVDRSVASPFYHHVFVADSNSIRQFNSAVPGVPQKTYNASNSPIQSPGQLALTQETRGPNPLERLLVADRGRNRVVMINPATDTSKLVGIPLNSPRGVAVDTEAGGKLVAYVAEPTRVLKFPVYKSVYVSAWVNSGVMSDAQVRLMIDEANKTFEKCGYEIQLRDNAVKPFSAPTLMDVHITDWSTVNCASQPTRTGDEAALLDDGSRRSAVTTDINVYFVRSFLVGNGLPPDKTLAETIAQDCFSGMPIGDSANSGIIVWSDKVRGNFKRFMRILAHELGHAMLDRGDWGDEHKNFFGQVYAAPFVMKHDVDEKSVQFDLNECTSMNKDLTIFQGDP